MLLHYKRYVKIEIIFNLFADWYEISAPKVFAFAFNIVKKFFDEYTLSKILIYKTDRNKWLPELLKKMDKSQLPKYLGGELTDDEGDPRCEKLVRLVTSVT